MIQIVNAYDKTPICPHCETPISQILMHEIKGLLGRRYIYFCSACSKTLGISHRKGFFMG